jgi:hypothetical protein
MKTRPSTPPQSAANIWMRSVIDIGRTSIGHRALVLDRAGRVAEAD